jgi:hypothetical protein
MSGAEEIEAIRGPSMKPSSRDEIEAKFRDAKGKAQENAGQATKVQRGIAKTAEMHGEFAPDLGKE